MIKTKYTGVYYRENQNKTKTFYIKYKINGKQQLKKVGTSAEGITAAYASKLRAKDVSIDRLKDDAPFASIDKSLTFDEAFNLYYEHAKYNQKDHYTNLKRYNKHIKNEIGHMLLERVDKTVMASLKKTFINKINDRTNKPYAQATINHFFDLIRSVFNYVINEKGLNLINPASSKSVKRLKVDNKRERYLELDEIRALFQEVEKEFDRKFQQKDVKVKILTFLMLSFSTGARLGSITTIKKQDLNFKQKTILIKNHKTGKTYTGYIHPKYEEFLLKRCSKLKTNDYLVSGSKEIYGQPAINYHLKPILDKLFNQGLDCGDSQNRAVVHTFRHTFASHLAIAGTPLYTIMRLMNHEDISQTIRYAKLSPDNGAENVFGLKF